MPRKSKNTRRSPRANTTSSVSSGAASSGGSSTGDISGATSSGSSTADTSGDSSSTKTSSAGSCGSSTSSSASSSSSRTCGKCNKNNDRMKILCGHCGTTYHGDCCITYVFEGRPEAWRLARSSWRCDECFGKWTVSLGTDVESRGMLWAMFKTMKSNMSHPGLLWPPDSFHFVKDDAIRYVMYDCPRFLRKDKKPWISQSKTMAECFSRVLGIH